MFGRFLFFLILCLVSIANAGEISVTFDDLPAVRPADVADAKQMTIRLLETIAAEKIPVTAFVNEKKLETNGQVDPAMVAVLRMWLDAGLELGNHTYSHMDLHQNSLLLFEQDVVRGETVTSQLLKQKGKTLRYFRHPYLHTGMDLDTKRKLSAFLAERGYTIAPVSIDNAEWIFALAYDRVDEPTKSKIVDSYIQYMRDKITFFENESRKLLGRNIRHILLLHANHLNADNLPGLIEMIRQKGYQFISLGEALQDEAYKLPDTFTGRGGISWIHRWALTRKVEKDFFKGEPEAPPFILQAAGVTEE